MGRNRKRELIEKISKKPGMLIENIIEGVTIVEAHGGKISVKSALKKGTTFTVTIPVEPKKLGGENVWVEMPESSLLTTTRT